ncbi:outer membrane protein OmpA-like peptidoglycan-associated protein [Rhizobium skierniewicense]|uniref:Outer membrane protein OmpA-like peptidoglycan-associated protein n=1 Tax=Rhizobium skierniewicense TaxID=984260 RepID=A0A7W6G3K6_9HYPH|nr:OmpA family protein [Rhizobium skierniewicense]MBB3947930.1 outer membrane protein OmpA-like peptidoglycan-associated protein [Rhizobium skierniewicense]
MLKKNKLLTGVVFPLMSFAIAAEPALAVSGGAAQFMSPPAVVRADGVPVLLAQAEPSAEEPLKKRQAEQQPEEPKAEKPRGEEPKAEKPAEEAPRQSKEEAPAPRREAAPESAGEPQKEPERPARGEAKPDAAPAEAQPEQQRRAQQPATEGEARPERPRRDAQPDAAPAQAQPEQQQERPRRQQGEQKPAAEGEQKPRPDGERPRAAQEPAPAAGEANPEKPAVPGKKPAAPEPDAKAAPVPTEPTTPGRSPKPAEQPNPAPGQQPSEQPRPPRGAVGEQPPLPDAAPKLENGAATGQAPAGEPVPQQIVTPQQEAPASTKQELDRARAVAKDPSQSADTVILPVDKGAAVLDSDKEAERSGNQQSRNQRRQEREAVQDYKVPTSDAEAQSVARGSNPAPQINIQAITNIQGERINERPDYDRPEGVREWQPRDMPRGGPRDRDMGDRVFMQYGDRVVVRGNDNDRFIRDGAKPYYERLPDDRYRETVERSDGTQVVTVRNRYGDVIQRSRIDSRGREYVLFYAPELVDQPDREYVYRDPGLDLPPMRLRIPVDDYIIDTSSEPDRDYYRFLEQPPVEPVERVYTMDEVRYSARIRDKVRRIDLDTITFATGSAEIPMSQAQSLRKVADAIGKVLKNNPAETFLIEGHTDAVGNDESNLVLSDERAASVANVMTDVYGIPPENLTTQGYGERFLKVQTLGPSQENRRVTIRRITSLVKPVAQN